MGFAVGNERLIAALARIKSYLDYGAFTPIQVAAAAALNGPQDCVDEIRAIYKSRRDCLVESFARAGWDVPPPPASMFAWAPIPEAYREVGSVEFAKLLVEKADIAVSPGLAFGEYGEGFVRIALVENEHRIRQAAQIPPGRSVFLLDPRAVARGVEALPEVERAEVIRELPDRVTVVVEERRPFTLVHAGRLHWIDESGHVLGRETQAVTPPAPVISGLTEAELLSMKVAPSGKARDALRLIRALLRSGSALAAEISEIDVRSAEGPVLYTGGGIEVRLGSARPGCTRWAGAGTRGERLGTPPVSWMIERTGRAAD
jgi:DNA-binding transcriptional ArsR family regulator